MKKLFGLLVLALLVMVLCCTGALAWDTYTYEGEYFCTECNATVRGKFTYIQFEDYHNLEFLGDNCLHYEDIVYGEPHSFDNDADATCNDCGYTRGGAEHAHVWSSEWAGNNWYHWHNCTVDGCDLASHLGEGKDGFGRHTLGDGHTHEPEGGGAHRGTCTVCGKADVLNYLYTPSWKYDDTHHWIECGCGAKEREGKHLFDSDADLTCNDPNCGYTREVAHDHSGGTATCTEQAVCTGCGESYGEVAPNAHNWGAWQHGGTTKQDGHFRHCFRDGSHVEREEHTGGNATCTVQGKCGVCYGLYDDINNHGDHGTSEWKIYSDTHHYHTCLGCYNNILTVEHDFDSDIDPKCDTCGYTREVAHEHDWGEWKSNGDSYHTRTCQTDGCNESERKKCRTTHDCFRVYCTECDYETLFDSAHHEWMYADSNGDNTHTFICSRDSSHTEIGSCYGGTATCTKRAMCAGCFSYHGEALGHAPGAEATCTTDQVCTREGCGTVLKEKLGHAPGAEATCTTDQVCTREGCGVVLKEKLGHTEVVDPAVAPSCTETGLTEGKHCDVCKTVLVAQEVVPANGHSYESETIAPTCTKSGYTTHICAVCGDTYTDNITNAREHWYDLWHPNGNGTHSADCKRDGCKYVGTTECTPFEITIINGDVETILTICPVCGAHEKATLGVVSVAALKNVYINQPLPHGEQIVRELDAPFNSVLYAFTVAYELTGRVVPFNGKVSVSLPLDAEKYAGFKLMRVGVTPATETTERAEVWTDVAFTFENGKLTFETDIAGLFLLVPIE